MPALPMRGAGGKGAGYNLNAHLHFLVTEGGVDAAGVFHKIPWIDDSLLAGLTGT